MQDYVQKFNSIMEPISLLRGLYPVEIYLLEYLEGNFSLKYFNAYQETLHTMRPYVPL